ncbi:hypothetical protein [Brachybacterium sillae]|uniref:hypothetical protein n=1 Tax=Brachybacterium sillae TaxID=2810536 RepID=UPI003D81436F
MHGRPVGLGVGASAFARICPTERVDVLITDAEADPGELAALRAWGVEVRAV